MKFSFILVVSVFHTHFIPESCETFVVKHVYNEIDI